MPSARPWRLRLVLAVCALVVVPLPPGHAQQPGAASAPSRACSGVEKDLTNFNKMLRDRGIQHVIK